jgi:hypothetical protein
MDPLHPLVPIQPPAPTPPNYNRVQRVERDPDDPGPDWQGKRGPTKNGAPTPVTATMLVVRTAPSWTTTISARIPGTTSTSAPELQRHKAPGTAGSRRLSVGGVEKMSRKAKKVLKSFRQPPMSGL